MHGHMLRRVDADADLIALHPEYGDRDLVTDDEGFADVNRPGFLGGSEP
jgi:hypothetical protein